MRFHLYWRLKFYRTLLDFLIVLLGTKVGQIQLARR
jgi:hypothetical protein